jgi:hypothetical protein
MFRKCPVLAILLLLPIIGCAQRQLTINSDPSGAVVYLNGDEIGRTPLKYDFLFYSNYDIVIRKEGYETLKTQRNLKAPLSAIPPFDLLGELFGTKDRREWNFTLVAADPHVVDPATLLTRARAMEAQLQSSKFTRLPASLPSTQPTAGAPVLPSTRPASTP